MYVIEGLLRGRICLVKAENLRCAVDDVQNLLFITRLKGDSEAVHVRCGVPRCRSSVEQ